ncbi:MAG TPA: transcription termination factor NusA [Candidatus Hydrogenedentes bacterium]|nr:transcription termination factor NusA [Candidatus Hydrogenedentota bacterium]HNT88284.1 transcription termination factor NusA [Candidatus Hydrogenedentota bacterium]
MDQNLRVILQQLEAEKSIDRATLIEAIRSAIESAARKSLSQASNIVVEVDADTFEFKVYEILTVVDKVTHAGQEMLIDEARKLNADVQVGNRLKVRTEPKDFGRIAAQTAKQVIIQKIKDAERDKIFDEFKQREGELVTGIVKRISHGNIIVSIGRAEAVLPYREQSPRENFKPGDRIRAFLFEVEKGPRGAQVMLSRSAPELVRGLFELEVPEIYDGTVEIRAIAREPGGRTKVAVYSHDANVDPVGACVGMKGSRVRAVVEELCGEKIDIVRWSDNPMELCRNALNPADILDMELDEENRSIHVMVPQDQLSLAIGKRGQNARLASKLIEWNIDIRGDVEPGVAVYAREDNVEVVGDPGEAALLHEPAPEEVSAPERPEGPAEDDAATES